MDNKEKTYTTDWKFFKNYIIYVNERNTKVGEDKYEKKCYIGLSDQSQKRLDLLSNRIDKSVYTIYVHNSYLDVLDLDFVKKYVLVTMILFHIEKIKQFVCLVMLETDYLMNKH